MMRIELSLGILVAVVLLTGPGQGLAQRPADPEVMFERLDQDGDGVVSSDEVPAEQKERFDRLLSRGDQDQDGKLTREEFMAVREEAQSRQGGRPGGGRSFDPERMFERMDANGDGKITRDELPEQVHPCSSAWTATVTERSPGRNSPTFGPDVDVAKGEEASP